MTLRNNEERLGINPTQQSTVEEVMNSSNDNKLSIASPTDFVELPSKGKYYPSDSSLKDKESLEFRYMTARQEDILTNKSLLKKGIAIDRMLQSLLLDSKVHVDDMLVGDKNAFVIAARISGYGTEYSTKVACPTCDNKFNFVFNLEEIKNKEIEENMLNENGIISLILPRTNANVECKLLTGKDEKLLSQLLESKRRKNLPDNLLTDQLKAIIISVNGDTDTSSINSFVNNMPASDSRYLRVEYYKRVPDVDMNMSVTCTQCDDTQEVIMPLGAEFFWPQR